MSSVADTLGVTCTTARASDLDTELVAIPVYEDDDLADLPELDSGTGGEIARARASGEIRGKPYELYTTGVRGWRAPRVLLVGAGRRDQESTYRLRQVAATASATARERHVRRIGFLSRSQLDVAAAAQAVAEGVVLGAFEDRRYKTDPAHDEGLVACDVAVPESSGVVARPAVERGQVLAYASNLARTLANEPGNVLTPRVFAERADTILAASGVSVDVLEEGRIAALKMGLLLGVARGSAEPPRLILMRYDPPGAPPAPVLGLVGKGVTFDSGGISLKPAEAMERMKEDMAGGAAVMCALHAISALKPAVRVIGVVPATENMPGGKAIKPGDILTSASGKTIEVINTDAEGRLILADALWYAQQLGATHLVDAATLTGSCVVALGKVASGLLGRPESWSTRCGVLPIAPAIACGLFRCSRSTGISCAARWPTSSTAGGGRPARARPRCSSGSLSATCRGRISTSPEPRGRMM